MCSVQSNDALLMMIMLESLLHLLLFCYLSFSNIREVNHPSGFHLNRRYAITGSDYIIEVGNKTLVQ